MKKPEKLPKLTGELQAALAILSAHPAFKALERLIAIEEKNIIISAFKVNSSDPHLPIKKAWHEGRLFELRAMLKAFEKAKKHQEKEK